jgi:hypothetical protein
LTSWSGASLTSVETQSVIIINGTDFGEKAPTVTMEYTDPSGVARSQRLRIVGVPEYADYKGKPNKSYTDLDPTSGTYCNSKLKVELPRSFWRDWRTGDTIQIKITNKFSSVTSVAIPTIYDVANNMIAGDYTVNVNSGDYDKNNYYLIDVLANDSDALSGKVTIVLGSRTSTQGGRLSVDAKTNKVKYTRPAGKFATYTDTFQYRLKDKDGNLTPPATVTVNVTLNP